VSPLVTVSASNMLIFSFAFLRDKHEAHWIQERVADVRNERVV
jgi:hypothetical protein